MIIRINLIDANKHVIELTFIMPNGKPVELRAELQRTNDHQTPVK